MKKVKLGVISPASSIIGEKGIAEFNEGIKKLEDAGFEIVFGKNIFSDTNKNWYCGSIDEKLNDIYEITSECKYVICSTGGTNSNSILSYLDFDKIKGNIFIGNSNPTLLFNAFYKTKGITSYIGPNVKSLGKSNSLFPIECLKNIIINNDKKIMSENNNIVIKEGICEGIAIGGNIQSMRRIIGTKFFPKTDNCILYLEASVKETNECEFDSIINQFRQAGVFDNIKGIILGYYGDNTDFYKNLFEGYSIPIIVCNNFGHGVNNNMMPLGKKIKIVNNKIIEM